MPEAIKAWEDAYEDANHSAPSANKLTAASPYFAENRLAPRGSQYELIEASVLTPYQRAALIQWGHYFASSHPISVGEAWQVRDPSAFDEEYAAPEYMQFRTAIEATVPPETLSRPCLFYVTAFFLGVQIYRDE